MGNFWGTKIEGDTAFEQQLKDSLVQIAANPVGQLFLQGIGNTGKQLTFIPYGDTDEDSQGECNAFPTADDEHAAHPQSAPYYFKDDGTPYGPTGTGDGSDVKMHYSPSTFERVKCKKIGIFGSLPDEVLMHELVHAQRMMEGKNSRVPTKGNLIRYTNEEEFIAIVVTNVYISSKLSTGLRANHEGFDKLEPPLDTSDGFLTDAGNLRLMNIYRLIWEPTFLALSRFERPICTPFRQFVLDQKR